MRLPVATLLILALSSCRDSDRSSTLFTLMMPEETGIDFENTLKQTPEFNIYTYRNFFNGGGVSVGDINNDGLPDLFFCGNLVDNRLYLNLGDFRFQDITLQAGVASDNVWSTGVSMADINGDGWLDIYVCKSGRPGGEKRHNELFINNGDGTFTEMAHAYGLADEGFSTHAVFFDYDKDGDLDCYLLNNSFRPVGGFDMRPGLRDLRDSLGGNKLYRNMMAEQAAGKVPQGTPVFVDVSEAAGIYGSSIGFGLGVTIGDINKDSWLDIYVSNDFFERDYLYINRGDGTFSEELTSQMREISMGSMGADMADIDNDGYPEIFVTEMLPRSDSRYKTKMTFENWDKYQLAVRSGYHHQFTRNTLQLNNRNGTFSEIGRLAGVDATDWSWSALIADLDNDGFKDVYVSNGIWHDLLDQDYINYYSNDPDIIESIKNREPDAMLRLISLMPSEPVSNFAFRNRGDLTFEETTNRWGLSLPGFSNGAIYADLDNDGDLDLIINNVNAPALLYRNETNRMLDHHHLQISFRGEGLNTFGLGSQVTLHVREKMVYQELAPMRGFQSCVEHRLTFGLGQTNMVDRLKVLWPDGRMTILDQVPADQHLILHQSGAGTTEANGKAGDQPTLFGAEEPGLLSYTHTENDFIDFDRDRLLFHMVSASGPRIAAADINGDGLPDLYFCGAAGQPGSLFVSQENESWQWKPMPAFEEDRMAEDTDARFFDATGNGLQDLVVTSGGNEYLKPSGWLEDRLYVNDGQGQFIKVQGPFGRGYIESSSCVDVADFDGDGLLDLFIGTRLVPGVYGVPVNGYLWRNAGEGKFVNVTNAMAPDLLSIGLITDAQWADIDDDGDADLVVVGEWMPVTILRNDNGRFTNVTKAMGLDKTHGWWQRVRVTDLDGDGSPDLVLGNHGLNSRFRASAASPIRLYINDFDGNQTPEQVYAHQIDKKWYPLALRSDLVMQMPGLKKKYLYHVDYQGQSMEDIFAPKALRTAAVVEAYQLANSVAWNLGNRFVMQPLPTQAQFAPIHAIEMIEDTASRSPIVVLGGNFHRAKPEVGKYDASYGTVLTFDGRQINVVTPEASGLQLHGEIRDLMWLAQGSRPHLLIARNNESAVLLPWTGGGTAVE